MLHALVATIQRPARRRVHRAAPRPWPPTPTRAPRAGVVGRLGWATGSLAWWRRLRGRAVPGAVIARAGRRPRCARDLAVASSPARVRTRAGGPPPAGRGRGRVTHPPAGSTERPRRDVGDCGCRAGLAVVVHRHAGPQWNTRVVVIPGVPRITSGPYRFVSHPNYVAVVAEGAALPLVHTAWITAVLFSVLNAALLRTRIKFENAALASLT